MKVLFLNTLFDGGGAEKIARQVYREVKKKDKVRYVVGFNTMPIEDEHVSVLYHGIFKRIFNRLITRNHCHVYGSLGYSRRQILKIAKQEKVSIIHLHNAHGHYLGLKDIRKLADSYPLVWTIHDCWVATGHCAFPFDCPRLDHHCTQCPHPEYYPPVKRRGAIASEYEKKKTLCQNANITFVTPSKWMKDVLIRDMIPEGKIQVIYNGIDMNEFTVMDKSQVRKELGIPEKKKVVGVIAAHLGIKQKGMHLFVDAIKMLPQPDQYHVVVAGNGEGLLPELEDRGMSFSYIGYLHGGQALSRFYSSLDVLVCPSLAESFGLVNVEAMACGTPPVAYDVGPIREIITEEVGWVAPECTAECLSAAVQQAFDNDEYKEKAKNCIQYVHDHFSLSKMTQAYLDLYAAMNREIENE